MPLQRRQRVLASVAAATILCVILIFGVLRLQAAVQQDKCSQTLRILGGFLAMYSNSQGVLPPDLPALTAEVDTTTGVFVCPATNEPWSTATTPAALRADFAQGRHCSYFYVGDGFVPASTSLNSPQDAKVVLLFESPHNHGGRMNVLFADQHREVVSGAKAEAILKQHANGIRPIRVR